MDSIDLESKICRICLTNIVIFNWNDGIFEPGGITYKDCYYKYTRLKEYDSDSYPTNLCEICAKELRTAHILFVKALESFEILQTLLKKNKQLEYKSSDSGICNNLADIKCGVEDLNVVDYGIDDNRLTGTKYESQSSPQFKINDSEKTPMGKDVTSQAGYFIDIQNLKSITDTAFSQCTVKDNTYSKKKKIKSVPLTILLESRQSEASNSKTQKPKQHANTRKRRHHLLKASMEQKTDVTLLEQIVTESNEHNALPSSTRKIKKSNEKYVLICAYCSQKVRGPAKLAEHEARHSENRKRNEECPKCGIKLYTKDSLNDHMKIHVENRQKDHKCEFCEKAFFNKGALNVHRRIHLGLMVKCKICSKEYFRQIDLDKHLVKHSASPLERNIEKKTYLVQCEYCNKSVKTTYFKAHFAAHMDQPQVKCKICDKNFFSKAKCTKHLKQVHHKKLNEYEDFIHYYVDCNQRMTTLIMKQKFTVQTVTE